MRIPRFSLHRVIAVVALFASASLMAFQAKAQADTYGQASGCRPAANSERDFEIQWAMFLGWVDSVDQVSNEARDKGDNLAAEHWKHHIARVADLTDSEATILLSTAREYHAGGEKLAGEIHTATLQFRANHPRSEWKKSSPEIDTLREQLHTFYRNQIASLNEQLGSKSFAKVDAYRLHMFPPRMDKEKLPVCGANDEAAR